MEKLELKHLVPYFEYDVRFCGASDFWVLEKITHGGIIRLSNGLHKQIGNINDLPIDYSLVLYPLSMLTKEIEVNGEKIIPIVELAKLFHNNNENVTHYENPRAEDDKYIINCCVENDSSRYLYYAINKDININEYRVVEFMAKCHLDIFNLIGKGLAINKTTIKL